MERCRKEARGWRWGRACGRTEAAVVAQTAFTFELQPPGSMPIWTARYRPDSRWLHAPMSRTCQALAWSVERWVEGASFARRSSKVVVSQLT